MGNSARKLIGDTLPSNTCIPSINKLHFKEVTSQYCPRLAPNHSHILHQPLLFLSTIETFSKSCIPPQSPASHTFNPSHLQVTSFPSHLQVTPSTSHLQVIHPSPVTSKSHIQAQSPPSRTSLPITSKSHIQPQSPPSHTSLPSHISNSSFPSTVTSQVAHTSSVIPKSHIMAPKSPQSHTYYLSHLGVTHLSNTETVPQKVTHACPVSQKSNVLPNQTSIQSSPFYNALIMITS